MRFVFFNIHCCYFLGTPLFFYLSKRATSDKHSYFLKFLLSQKMKVAVFIDRNGSSFPENKFQKLIPRRLEFYLWAKLNRIPHKRISIITKFEDLNENDVFFSYLWQVPIDKEGYKKCKAVKVLHATHFMHGIENFSRIWGELGVDSFVCENNLAKNSSFFAKYMSWYKKDVYTLPFVWQPRFKNTVPFRERRNKAIATGTTFRFEEKAFNEFFKVFYYHPMRQLIYENKENLASYLDSFISDYYEGKKLLSVSKDDNFFQRAYKDFFNNHWSVRQVNYRAVNIVQKYNEYKMSIIPEEINNMPALGFVESMACGCAYIGIRDPMYSDLGMVPGFHYIGYDGTLDDLKRVITYYQTHEDELEQIARRGHEFILDTLNPQKVAEAFCRDLSRFCETRLQKGPLEFPCSFLSKKATTDY